MRLGRLFSQLGKHLINLKGIRKDSGGGLHWPSFFRPSFHSHWLAIATHRPQPLPHPLLSWGGATRPPCRGA